MKLPVWLAMVGTVFAGSLTATQSFLNGRLTQVIGSAVVASWFSFTAGLIIILILTATLPTARAGVVALRAALRAGSIKYWMLLGGLSGAFFVFSQSLVAGVLGVSLFTMGIVAGQVLGGFVFDAQGLAPLGRRKVDTFRALGSLITIGAVAIAVWSRLEQTSALWLVVLPMVSGVFVAWQSGVNGRVNQASSSSVVSTAVNFIVGTVALTVLVIIWVAIEGFPTQWPSNPWLYLGGPIGLVFIALSSLFVRVLGILVLALAYVAGQLTAAILFDSLAPIAQTPVTVGLVVGLVLAFVGMVVAGWRELKRDRVHAVPVTGGGSEPVRKDMPEV